MGCLGSHLALSDEDVYALRAIDDEQDRLEYLEDLADGYFDDHPEYLAASDKAWDAMGRALSDGETTSDCDAYPLDHVVLGGELLYTGSDYIMSLKSPEQVRDIAAALPAVTEAEFRRRYYSIDADDYGFPLSDEDLAYTWEWFPGVRELYLRAASEGRSVLFRANQ